MNHKKELNKPRSKTSHLKPGQTKSSLQRQLISQQKKLESTSVLWEKIFKRMPKSCRDLSEKAKTCGKVDWKKECIYCAKERRSQKVKKLNKVSTLESAKKAKAQATRSLAVKWLLVLEDNYSKQQEYIADEDFIFSTGISIRWNQLDSPSSLSKLKHVMLYALTPLFYDKGWIAEKNSACSRSLIFKHSFKDLPFKKMNPLHGDDYVAVYRLDSLYFAVWKSSLPDVADIAFVGASLPLHDLLLKTQMGDSERSLMIPPHLPIPDDVDSKYGLHGYTAVVTLRNCRKLFFYDIFKEFNDGVWKNHWLHIEQRRYKDYVFYDIKEKMSFLWKTAALKGCIEDMVILDIKLHDINNEIMWSKSQPIRLTQDHNELDNYSYENCEIWKLGYKETHIGFSFEVIKNSLSKESTILSLTLLIHEDFINKWYQTNY